MDLNLVVAAITVSSRTGSPRTALQNQAAEEQLEVLVDSSPAAILTRGAGVTAALGKQPHHGGSGFPRDS